MRVLLDTNALLRLVDPQHFHHQVSSAAIDCLDDAGHDLIIVPQILYEFWTVATRPIENNGLGMDPGEAEAELVVLKRLFRFMRDKRAVYNEWERIVTVFAVRGKQSHDARLVAAMARHGITHLLTFNHRDFARFSSIVALPPDDVVHSTGFP